MYTQHSAIYQSLQLTSTQLKQASTACVDCHPQNQADCKPLCHHLCANVAQSLQGTSNEFTVG